MIYRYGWKCGRVTEYFLTFEKRARGKEVARKRVHTPEEIEATNRRNAVAELTRILNANFSADDIHLVLTYARDQRPEKPEDAKAILDTFLSKLRYEYKKQGFKLKYITTTEYHHKAIHHHLVINSPESWNAMKIVRKLWTKGNPRASFLDDSGEYSQLASYLIKETAKTFRLKDSPQKKMYNCSRGLIRPQAECKVLFKRHIPEEPKIPDGCILLPDSLFNGVNPISRLPYQRYKIVALRPGETEQDYLRKRSNHVWIGEVEDD